MVIKGSDGMPQNIKDEIKGLVFSKGYKMKDVAEYLGMSVQNLNRKLNEETLRLTEYRKILEFINKKGENK